MRGNAKDYDNWAAMGNSGWSFKDVLPYFKKLEDMKHEKLINGKYIRTYIILYSTVHLDRDNSLPKREDGLMQ